MRDARSCAPGAINVLRARSNQQLVPSGLRMRNFVIIVICLMSLYTPAARSTDQTMSAADWDAPADTTFERREGFPSGIMTLPRGIAVLKNASFSNGTIEFDLKPLEFSDTSIQLRREDANDSEFVYIRADPDCPAANDCIQYAPITHGLMQWDLYPQFQAPAPVSEKGWNHLKIVVAGRRMQVFVNREQIASLTVDRLQGLTDSGGIALKGPAAFANLVLRPNEVSGLKEASRPVRSEPRTVNTWLVAPPVPLPVDQAPSPLEIPSTVAWRRVRAESDGLVNLSREFGPTASPAVVWLKTGIVETDRAAQALP